LFGFNEDHEFFLAASLSNALPSSCTYFSSNQVSLAWASKGGILLISYSGVNIYSYDPSSSSNKISLLSTVNVSFPFQYCSFVSNFFSVNGVIYLVVSYTSKSSVPIDYTDVFVMNKTSSFLPVQTSIPCYFPSAPVSFAGQTYGVGRSRIDNNHVWTLFTWSNTTQSFEAFQDIDPSSFFSSLTSSIPTYISMFVFQNQLYLTASDGSITVMFAFNTSTQAFSYAYSLTLDDSSSVAPVSVFYEDSLGAGAFLLAGGVFSTLFHWLPVPTPATHKLLLTELQVGLVVGAVIFLLFFPLFFSFLAHRMRHRDGYLPLHPSINH
jgi:hypothetical protein